MDDARIILILGTVVLACGSLSFGILRMASPKLRGTAWLSGAFAVGALGASLLMVQNHWLFSIFFADLFLLSSFVLLHVGVLELIQNKSVPFWHGGLLLGMQAVVDVLRLSGAISLRPRVAVLGLLVAVQSFATALVLCRLARRQIRAPSVFSAVLLLAFGCFNLFRSGAMIFAFDHRVLNRQLSVLTFLLFVGVALALAFGFFWMTTAMITDELEHMASTDPLTRLYNRRVFLKWCEKELLRSQRSGVPFSLLMVDLDHFKRVNDNFGHQTGDEVLCAAVEQMQDSVRGIDVLCRWGGEEFAVLLPSAPPEATLIVAERIRENIQKVTLSAARTTAQVTEAFSLSVSIGTATYRDLDDGLTAMLQRADRALYSAKRAGRNRVLVAS